MMVILSCMTTKDQEKDKTQSEIIFKMKKSYEECLESIKKCFNSSVNLEDKKLYKDNLHKDRTYSNILFNNKSRTDEDECLLSLVKEERLEPDELKENIMNKIKEIKKSIKNNKEYQQYIGEIENNLKIKSSIVTSQFLSAKYSCLNEISKIVKEQNQSKQLTTKMELLNFLSNQEKDILQEFMFNNEIFKEEYINMNKNNFKLNELNEKNIMHIANCFCTIFPKLKNIANNLKDKDVTLLFGTSGCGSSTFINYLAGYEMKLVNTDDYDDLYDANGDEVMITENEGITKIHHTLENANYFPEIFNFNDNYIVSCNFQNSKNDTIFDQMLIFLSRVFLQMLLNKNIKYMVIIEYNSIIGKSGVFNNLDNILKDFFYTHKINYNLLIVNKIHNMNSKDDQKRLIIDNYKQLKKENLILLSVDDLENKDTNNQFRENVFKKIKELPPCQFKDSGIFINSQVIICKESFLKYLIENIDMFNSKNNEIILKYIDIISEIQNKYVRNNFIELGKKIKILEQKKQNIIKKKELINGEITQRELEKKIS